MPNNLAAFLMGVPRRLRFHGLGAVVLVLVVDLLRPPICGAARRRQVREELPPTLRSHRGDQ